MEQLPSFIRNVVLIAFVALAPGWAAADPPSTNADDVGSVDDPSTGLAYSWLPSGSFLFGCDEPEQCEAGAAPPTERTAIEGFWLSRNKVTHEQYAACVAAGVCSERATYSYCTTRIEPTAPVSCVDLAGAQAYCAWAGGNIPTDAHWEYAADGGFDTTGWVESDPSRLHDVYSDWVRPSTPSPPGYAASRGGIGDIEPWWPSDRSHVQPDHRSKSLGFHCVRPPVDAREDTPVPVELEDADEQCANADQPFLSPGTRTELVLSAPTVHTFWALCEGEEGPRATQMPMYLDRHEPGEAHYQLAPPCAYRWAFSNELPRLGNHFARAPVVPVFHDGEYGEHVPGERRVRTFGDASVTEEPPSDFPDFPARCTVERSDGATTIVHYCKLLFAGDLNGDAHTDFVFHVHDFPGCDGAQTLLSTATGWSSTVR